MNGLMANIKDVLRVALPLLVSTGMHSLVLFTDRTLLYRLDDSALSASMTGGNLFWLMSCFPYGIASMTGAIIAQHIGAKQEDQVGRLLWQSVWLSLLFIPLILLASYFGPWIWYLTKQPIELIAMETSYLRILMFATVGIILDGGLSGFFSGTERTRYIMFASIASAIINVVLDVWLIFGGLGVSAMGIEGAAIASVVAFWFKPIFYACLLFRKEWDSVYLLRRGFCFDWKVLSNLIFYGFPAGLHSVAEAGCFVWIILNIGHLGDLPLQATTMAINFNMIAFIPLVGLQIGTSVVVGKRLTESGPDQAAEAVKAAMIVSFAYCGIWAFFYLVMPGTLLGIYASISSEPSAAGTIEIARQLLLIVTAYLFFDAIQVILAGALRGAGDTWFVLIAVVTASVLTVVAGSLLQPWIERSGFITPLNYWWVVMCAWVWALAIALSIRYRQGKWRRMRMIETVH
jgi:multidrug resistance protein, MATE family